METLYKLFGVSELQLMNYDSSFINFVSPAITVWLTVAVVFIALVVVRGR